jgi:hypothetical protein
MNQVPELLGTPFGKSVLNLDGTAKTDNVLGIVLSFNTIPPFTVVPFVL